MPLQASQGWFGPFVKNPLPVLVPEYDSVFHCPVSGRPVHWEATNVYNPAAIVRNGKLHLIYRADDVPLDDGSRSFFGNPVWTCRLGHAVSSDGLHFERDPEPVLFPDKDDYIDFEWTGRGGGCQDLHIVEAADGMYYMNYTAYTGRYSADGFPQRRDTNQWEDVLMVASSQDLVHWEKHGPAFSASQWKGYLNHSRSGVVISTLQGDKLVAAQIRGQYWMYLSHKGWLATSDDLIHWNPVLEDDGSVKCLFPEFFGGGYASNSCEAGAAAILTGKGIVYFFNALGKDINAGVPERSWSLGQALVSADDLTTVLAVQEKPFIYPQYDWELKGNIPVPATVCNTIVNWQNEWTIYYGAADHVIGRAVEKGM